MGVVSINESLFLRAAGRLAGLCGSTNRERETEGGSVAEPAVAVVKAAGSRLHLWSGLGSLLGVGTQSAVYTE